CARRATSRTAARRSSHDQPPVSARSRADQQRAPSRTLRWPLGHVAEIATRLPSSAKDEVSARKRRLRRLKSTRRKAAQLVPRGDLELEEDLAEVVLNRSRAEEQLGGD